MPAYDSPPFIVDSHIHLYDTDALDGLSWLKKGDQLYRPTTVNDYVNAVNNKLDKEEKAGEEKKDGEEAEEEKEGDDIPSGPRVGYIFIECDRKNGTNGDDWTGPLEEVAYLRRVVEAEAEAATSATSTQARCLAIVPWAPVHSGPEALEKYLEKVEETAGPIVFPRIRGFRYLVQDKPNGTMLTDNFVESLKLLGRRGYSFDLGVDQHRRGRTQMAEAVALVEKVHGPDGGVPEDEKVVLVINHMAKPDITVLTPHSDRGFAAWRDTMFSLAKTSPDHIFMKVSGLFSEMPPALYGQEPSAFFAATYPWLAVLLAAFGAQRLMFGSDWPVCTIPYGKHDPPAPEKPRTPGEVGAWNKWRSVVAYLSYMATLSSDDEAMLWGGTAVKAYGLDKN
ncbi:L-rhamnono-gamma-lactonase [Sporothrix stenoceras]|uniref:L-rhamnono-gamma-lactonase n=1 Tax=Sporothrix stenoceras TaxID=5173 RepID=A0ABR3ZHS7_9PEZI